MRWARATLEQGALLTVIGDSPAGAPFGGTVSPGTAVKIATGGVVPPGADRIVVQEIVERDGDRIRIAGESRRGDLRPRRRLRLRRRRDARPAPAT